MASKTLAPALSLYSSEFPQLFRKALGHFRIQAEIPAAKPQSHNVVSAPKPSLQPKADSEVFARMREFRARLSMLRDVNCSTESEIAIARLEMTMRVVEQALRESSVPVALPLPVAEESEVACG
jgi:hypothetical protein